MYFALKVAALYSTANSKSGHSTADFKRPPRSVFGTKRVNGAHGTEKLLLRIEVSEY